MRARVLISWAGRVCGPGLWLGPRFDQQLACRHQIVIYCRPVKRECCVILIDTREERFVGRPSQGSRGMLGTAVKPDGMHILVSRCGAMMS